MSKPLAIDLFCGLGGWTDGLLAEGYRVIGFDVERHRYPARAVPDGDGTKARTTGVDFNSTSTESKHRSFNYANECAFRDAPLTGGWMEYPAQLVLQDVLTLHGSQFKDAALIVASPPCQEFSYMAMPWSLAKRKAEEYRGGRRDVNHLTALFDACFRIQREAIEASGRFIPLVVENVRGACPWVGQSRWNYGSFHLWGDVPALMPIAVSREGQKHRDADGYERAHPNAFGWKIPRTSSGSGTKAGRDWFGSGVNCSQRRASSKSTARKAASAAIAKIPLPLARHIASVWRPRA